MYSTNEIDKAFLQAANENKLADAQALLLKGANINAFDPDNHWTALAYFSHRGNLDAIRWLHEAGADVNAQSSTFKKTTALLEAAEQGRSECVQYLLANDANIEAKDLYSRSVLASACFHFKTSSSQVLRYLIDSSADVNSQDDCGYTPLMHLIGSASATVEAALLLLEHGADYSITNQEGETVIQICQDVVDGGYSKNHEALSLVLECLKNYQENDLLLKTLDTENTPPAQLVKF